ncbi:hypothetical protein ACMFMG_000478 [Clarireedia jacksonii]
MSHTINYGIFTSTWPWGSNSWRKNREEGMSEITLPPSSLPYLVQKSKFPTYTFILFYSIISYLHSSLLPSLPPPYINTLSSPPTQNHPHPDKPARPFSTTCILNISQSSIHLFNTSRNFVCICPIYLRPFYYPVE